MYDILIKNGIVFDGSGQSQGLRTDIAIEDNKITAIGDLSGAHAHEVIDAADLYVSPGFIDIQNHSDSHGLIFDHPALESMVAQGVTTIAIGQCGASLAPLPKPESLKSLAKWGELDGLNADWQTYGEFISRLKTNLYGANIASFIGHATLRRAFTGDVSRALTNVEIKQLAQLLDEALKQGAFGISFGFQYGHEIKSTPEEIFALLLVVKKYNKIFSLHLRSQDDEFLAALTDTLELARAVEVKTKISHLKVEGRKNFPQLNGAVALIEKTYQAGTEVRFDVYPYTTTWKPLYTYLPNWAYEGGFKPMLKRLRDKKTRPKVLSELTESRERVGSLFVSQSPRVSGFLGKTVTQISASMAKPVEEVVLNILSANHGQANVFDHDVDADEVTTLLKHPLSFVASDGMGLPLSAKVARELPHPRCFGSFPRFLRLLREGGDTKPLMSWSEGLAKITGHPAKFLGLEKRGLIAEGFAADVVIFDPKTIADTATYLNPFQTPQGIRYVINGGKISLFEGQLTGINSGKILNAKV